MAENQINNEDLFSPDLFKKTQKDLKDFIEQLNKLDESFINIGKSASESLGKLDLSKTKDIEKLNALLRENSEAIKALDKQQLENIKTQKQFSDLQNKLNKLEEENNKLKEKKLATTNKQIKAEEKKNKETEKSINETKKGNKVLTEKEKLQKKITDATSQENVELQKLRIELQEANKEAKLQAKLQLEVYDAYDQLVQQTNKAQKELKRLSAEFGRNSKQAKEAREEFDKLDKQLREINEDARDGRRDVGRYGIALEGLQNKLSGLSSQASEASNGLSDLASSLTSPAALATGAVTALGAAFAQSEGGARKVDQTLAKLKGGFNAITSSLGGFANNFIESGSFSEAYKKNLDGLVDKTIESAKANAEAEQKQYDLTVSLRTTGVELAKLSARYELLSTIAGDATISLEKQRKASLATQEEAVKIAQEEINIINQELEIINKQLEARKGLKNDELLNQQAELNKQLIEREGQLNAELYKLGQEQRQIEQDQWEQRLDFLFDASDRKKSIDERVLADERINIEERKKTLEDLRASLASTYDKINKEIQDQAGDQNFNVFQFADLSAEQQADYIKTLNLSEVETNRLKEAVVEYLAVVQDLEDATKDLNEAEAEIVESRKVVIEQEQLLAKLRGGTINSTDAQIEQEEYLVQTRIEALETEIEKRKELGFETVEQQKELNDLLIDLELQKLEEIEKANDESNKQKVKDDKDAQDKRKKQIEEFYESVETFFGALDDVFSERSQKRLDDIDKQLDASIKNQDRLREQLINGNAEANKSLADEENKQVELEKKKLEEEKRRAKEQFIVAGVQAYANSLKSGKEPPQAIAETITSQKVLTEILKSLSPFYHGTDDTGDGSNSVLSDKYGKITGYTHENEMVLSAKEKKEIGDKSRKEVVNAVKFYDNFKDVTPAIAKLDTSKLESKLDRIHKALENVKAPELDYDQLSDIVSYKVKKGQNSVVKKGIIKNSWM